MASGTTSCRPRRLSGGCRRSEEVRRQHFEASVSLLSVVGQSGLDLEEEVEEVEEGWEEQGAEVGWEGRRKEGGGSLS